MEAGLVVPILAYFSKYSVTNMGNDGQINLLLSCLEWCFDIAQVSPKELDIAEM